MSCSVAENRRYQKARRQRLIAACLCIVCATVPPLTGSKLCGGCGDRHRASARRWMRKKRNAWKRLGLCSWCGKRIPIVRQVLCGVCSEASVEYKKHSKAAKAAKAANACAG